MKKAVVLVSGGLDSCVTAAVAKDLGYNLCLLHVNYGQLTEKRELRAFNDIAEYYNVNEKLIVDISYLKEIGGSALTDENIDVEEGSLNRVGIPKTYVPFRNANILSIATAWAEVIKAEKIFIGAVEEDSSGYPDCRKVFYDAFNNLLKVGINPENDIEIITPLIELKKRDIVLLGKKLNAPLHLTWSCYKSEDLACGNCDSCFLRLRGFKEANVKDPIKYITYPKFYDTI
ncbi:7-cyano-7-deazaguanine synthase QueC [Deferribacterales bacterium Es71-Z0220]|uniref:7-cyano-7-deazaguanine synthase QueC n=1 Tax=Deferrivibrio essentukiensis TaxID=2880922 RepID=UPI001F6122DE|nr:7-cyano-7-deazaguanine synthase QueC [Deferrivibrio essentukiensis]MCB4204231.1 7-cyano-7-deazaguanine synthase QueC [Deferrivibrio essentukiensis]